MEDPYDKFFIAFGKATISALSFEFSLGTLLLDVDRVIKGNISVEGLFALDEKYSKLTLGQMLTELRKKISVNAVIEDQLRLALEKRNYLIHRFYTEDAEQLVLEENIDKVVTRIDKIREIIFDAEIYVKMLTSAFNEASGITSEILDEEHRKLIAKLKSSSV